jgi:transposase
VAEAILGLDYNGTMIHDGWSPYDRFVDAHHRQFLQPVLRRCDEMDAAATRRAVRFPRRVAELLRAALDLRDRHAAGEISRHGVAVACGRLENQLSDVVFPPKTNAANERLAEHLWAHRDDLFTFLRVPGLDATNWRAELASRFGVILRKVWGGSRTWVGARAQAVLMSVWRTCWQQGRSALTSLANACGARQWPWPCPRDQTRSQSNGFVVSETGASVEAMACEPVLATESCHNHLSSAK